MVALRTAQISNVLIISHHQTKTLGLDETSHRNHCQDQVGALRPTSALRASLSDGRVAAPSCIASCHTEGLATIHLHSLCPATSATSPGERGSAQPNTTLPKDEAPGSRTVYDATQCHPREPLVVDIMARSLAKHRRRQPPWTASKSPGYPELGYSALSHTCYSSQRGREASLCFNLQMYQTLRWRFLAASLPEHPDGHSMCLSR